MNNSELMAELLLVEQATGAWEERALGWQVWHLLRGAVFDELTAEVNATGVAHADWRQKNWKDLVRLGPAQLFDIAKRSRFERARHATLLVSSHPRHYPAAGGWACQYAHPLLSGVVDYEVFEEAYQGSYFYPLADDRTCFIDLRHSRAVVSHTLRTRRRRTEPPTGSVRLVREVCARLERSCRVRLSSDRLLFRLAYRLRQTEVLSDVWNDALDRVRPRAVVSVVHYALRNLVLTQVAKARGLPVIELQHGFTGPAHPGYNLPEGVRPEAFPDYFLSFGRYWTETTPGFPLPPARTIPVGFERLDAEVRGASATQKDSIVFLSQGTIGEELSKVAVELSRRRPTLKILYKLHPGEFPTWTTRYPWLASSNVEVLSDARTSVYDCFRRCHTQIGCYSTAVFEGLAFGLETWIVPLPGSEALEPLLARGLARPFEPDASFEPRALGASAIEDVWAPTPRERLAAFLRTLGIS